MTGAGGISVGERGGPGLAVVVPAFNEEGTVGDTVAALRGVLPLGRVVVVDDGSADETSARARAAGAEVVRMERNRGKGAALAAGFRHVLANGDGNPGLFPKPDLVLMIDADLGRSAAEAVKLVEACRKGADMSIAAFRAPVGVKGGGFGLVKTLSRWAVRRFGGQRIVFPLSGQRAFAPSVLEKAGPIAEGWGIEIVFTIEALRAGFKVVEVDTAMAHHATGRDWRGFVHRGRQFWGILLAVAPYLLGRGRGRSRGGLRL